MLVFLSLDSLLIGVSEIVKMELLFKAFSSRVNVNEMAEACIWPATAAFSILKEDFSGSDLGKLPLYC